MLTPSVSTMFTARSYHSLPTSQLSRRAKGRAPLKSSSCLEQPAELLALVRLADFLGDHPAQLVLQPRLALVVGDAFLEEVEALDDPAVALAVVVGNWTEML